MEAKKNNKVLAKDLIESWDNDDFDYKNYSELLKTENSKLIYKTQQLQTELKEAREMIATLNKELKQIIETDKNF